VRLYSAKISLSCWEERAHVVVANRIASGETEFHGTPEQMVRLYQSLRKHQRAERKVSLEASRRALIAFKAERLG
jgi:hypothetical protein